ncbi:MAG: hydroxymethylbilane synthase [Proteobacteria bacterium]|nr:MAG: hydroxymethylbilane synthase [Pseudomonadota bacterium]
MAKLIIGTRGSELARWQARYIKARLEEVHEGLTCELTIIKTRGDAILDRPLAEVGGKGLFVKEIEEALRDGRVDLAVHSMKDLPSELPPGLVLGAVPTRANPFDAWVRPKGAEPLTLDALPEGAVVGTSSLRRAAQLKAARPDLRIVGVRGNVGTRLRKLDEGQRGMVAQVLACAGLERLGLSQRITAPLDPEAMLPAVGQGALAVEIRDDDSVVGPLVAALDHAETRDATAAERAFLARLEGSCRIPIAGWATVDDQGVTLRGLIADPSGRRVFRDALSGPRGEAESLGQRLADKLLGAGGREVLAALFAMDAGA